jgi:predicted nucleotidyltransferase
VDVVVEICFGSHLYGTDTPESDLKGVYLPEAGDILLQRVTPSVATWVRRHQMPPPIARVR